MPRHKKKRRAAAATSAIAKRTDLLAGDLVVAKLRGHRPWPAQIQKPEDYGYDARPHRIFVTFFGTDETCFCSYSKITPFTSSVRKSLAEQLQKINTNPELERAIKEIFAADDELKLSAKAHGSRHKDDAEAPVEKPEEEASPVERVRKRARVVEDTVAEVIGVEHRPPKQEKTVKSMAVEQMQKLPRKVRIKVSTQSSDSSKQAGEVREAAQSENASVMASEPGSCDRSPPRAAESAKDNSAGRGERKADGASGAVKDDGDGRGTETGRHVSENGKDAAEKMDVDEGSAEKETAAAAAKLVEDGAEKMELDEDATQKGALKPKTDEVEKMEVGGDEKAVASSTGEVGESLKPGLAGSGDKPTGEVKHSADVRDAREERKRETPVMKGEVASATDEVQIAHEEKKQASPVSRKAVEPPSEEIERAALPESESERGRDQEGSLAPKVHDVAGESRPSSAKDPSEVDVAKEEKSKDVVSSSAKEDEASSRSEAKDGVSEEQVCASTTDTKDKAASSLSAPPDDAVPSSAKEGTTSLTKNQRVPASTNEQAPVSSTHEKTVHAPIDEKLPDSSLGGESGPATPAQVDAGAETTARVAAAPSLVNDQVSASVPQDKTVPPSIGEDASSSAKGDIVPSSVAEEKVSAPTGGDKTERTSTDDQGSVSSAQGGTTPSTVKEQVSTSGAQGEKGPSSVKDQQ